MRKDLIEKIKKEYKTNKKSFLGKVYVIAAKRIRFINISNKNIRELADREYVYKKLKKKYNKMLVRKEYDKNLVFSNKVFICWFQGYDKAPLLVKKCIDSVKKMMPDKEIIIIDEQNMNDYVTIPEYIVNKFKKGIISYAHFADILRLELLINHGGLWIDASVLVTGDNIYFNDETPLFVFKSISLNRNQRLAISASNWLIYSCKDNCILKLTRDLIYAYWKDYNITLNYLFFHIFFTLATEVYSEEWNNVPTFSNIPPHILQFELEENYNQERFEQIKKISSFHKLNRRVENKNTESNYYYIVNDKI